MYIKECFGLLGEIGETGDGGFSQARGYTACLECGLFDKCYRATVIDILREIARKLDHESY